MVNREIARIFSEIADIMEIKGDNPFKIRAYRKAALNVEDLARGLDELTHKELLQIPGIGADLAAKVEEYVRTGTIEAYEQLKREVPPGLHAMLAVPDIGPKTATLIHRELGISTLDELERAAVEHRLAGIRGIQQKTEENILKGIAAVKRGRERQPLGRMLPAALQLVEELKRQARIDRIEVAGSIRRRKESIKDLDLVATSPDPAGVMDAFVKHPGVETILMRGLTRSSVLFREGIQADLRVVEPDSFGAALAYFTGSKQHNVRLREIAVKRGMKLNEYGLYRADDGARLGGATEEEIYRLLELSYVEPTLREDLGEVEAAREGRLPQLVQLSDLKGDLHVHSRWSDGSHSIAEVAEAARARGLSYLVLTDHSQGRPGYAHGLSAERLRGQRREIDAYNESQPEFRVLQGTEMEILPDGSLDYPDEVLRELDLVVASIHSGFKQTKEQITARITAAMRHRFVDLIAHPTGRIIGEREPYPVDMEEVLKVAAETGTALEINAYPFRLDLGDSHAKRAKELGVLLAVNSDTHAIPQFDTLCYGVYVAQRAWLEKKDLLNSRSADELLGWVKRRRR